MNKPTSGWLVFKWPVTTSLMLMRYTIYAAKFQEKQGSMAYPTQDIVINGVFSPAVGHVVEAFMIANSIRNSAKKLPITILLNSDAPIDLAECVAHLNVSIIPVKIARLTDPGYCTDLFDNIGRWHRFGYTLRDERTVRWNDESLKQFHVLYKTLVKFDNQMGPRENTAISFPFLRPSPLRFAFKARSNTVASRQGTPSFPRIVLPT